MSIKLYIRNKNVEMLINTKLRAEIENFSDEFSIDELVERHIFIEKVENGLNSQRLEILFLKKN